MSQFLQMHTGTVAAAAADEEESPVIDTDWVDLAESTAINLEMMVKLFPDKDTEKIHRWLSILRDEHEFDTLRELGGLDSAGWCTLGLPLAVVSGLKAAVHAHSPPHTYTHTAPPIVAHATPVPVSVSVAVALPPAPLENFVPAPLPASLISQIDCVVIDVSGSMRSRSIIDVDKTREDVSKMLFHTMMDKLVCLELSHSLGLLAFGKRLSPFPMTTEYELFHDILGRLDANEGGTKLYDAIKNAAEMLDTYATDNAALLEPGCVRRVFVLTDGEDNESYTPPWQATQLLQQRSVVLDAIPLAAGSQKVLQAMCAATSGICFMANSQEQAVSLFEREATLHVAYREKDPPPPTIADMSAFTSLQESMTTVELVVDITSVVPQKAFAPAMSKSSALAAAVESEHSATSSCVTKRIMKEYREFMSNPLPDWDVFISATDVRCWKAFLRGSTGPYQGGTWFLTIDFPYDYPFKPPKVRFITPIYHCNINNDGGICIDILKDNWSPAVTISKAMMAISALLLEPNVNDPLDVCKAQICKDDKPRYLAEAALWTVTKAGASMTELATRYNVEL
jgi:ubiquitin-protein ligase/uncharacterized protein YegL